MHSQELRTQNSDIVASNKWSWFATSKLMMITVMAPNHLKNIQLTTALDPIVSEVTTLASLIQDQHVDLVINTFKVVTQTDIAWI